MQFSRVHRRASVIVAIALVAASIFASAASALVLEGPVHQTETTGPAVPAIHAPVQQPSFREAEAQSARDYWFSVPPIARYSHAEFNAGAQPAATPAVPAAKIAAPSSSFDWGDAVIGAGIAVVIGFLATGGVLIARRRTQLGEA